MSLSLVRFPAFLQLLQRLFSEQTRLRCQHRSDGSPGSPMYAGCARNQVQLEHLPLCMFSWASRLINLRANAFDARGLYLHCFSISNFLFSACSKEGYRTEFLPRLSQHKSKWVEMSSSQAYENESCSAQEVVTVGLLSSLPTVALLLGDMARALRTASCRHHV